MYGRRMARTIQIRDVPDEVHAVLRSRAALAGKSLSDFLRDEIEELGSRPPVAEVLLRARGRSGGADHRSVVAAVRSGRDQD